MDKIRLGDIATLINGDRGKNYPSQADITDEGDIPFVNAGHLNGRSIDFEEMNYISQDKFNRLSSGKFVKGDVLYCLRGSLGKKAIVNDDVEGAIASSLVIIRPDYNRIDGDYLLFSLDSPSIKEQLIKANNGSSQPNLSAASVREYQIELPDMKVQKDIVNKLAKVRTIIDSRQHEIDLLDQLIKARFVEMFGHQSHNEKGLPYMTIDDVAEIYLGITHTPEYVDEGVTFISAKNTSGDFLDLTDVKYISKEEFLSAPNGSKPQKNDVLFSRVGSNLGHPVILEDDIELCTFVSLGFLRTKGKVTSNYLKHWMRDDYFPLQVAEHVKGGGQPNLNTGWLKQFKIIVPDLDAQYKFDAFCEQVDKSKVVKLKAA